MEEVGGPSSGRLNSADYHGALQTPEVNTRGLVTALENPDLLTSDNLEAAYGQTSAILFINDEQLPGFHQDYVRRLGRNSLAPGLRVESRPRWGPNTESTLLLKLMVRDGNMSYTFAFLNINMSKLVEVVKTQVFATTDEAAINRVLSPGTPSFPDVVEAHHRDDRHREVFDGVAQYAPLTVPLHFGNSCPFSPKHSKPSPTTSDRSWKRVCKWDR